MGRRVPLNGRHHLPHWSPGYTGYPSLDQPGPPGVQWEAARGGQETHTNFRIHSVHCHVWDMLVILKEGNNSHPRCSYCDIILPWVALKPRHPEIDLCAQGAERKRRRMAEEEYQAGAVTAVQDYDRPLEIVSSFKYLRHLLVATDD